MKKLIIVALALLIAAIIVVSSGSKDQAPVASESAPEPQRASQPPQEQIHMHEYAATGRVPAYYTTVPDRSQLAPTLPPELFSGNQKLAYQAAKQIPQTLAQLPCYCHCDRSQNHKSLHSCFESEHGENCGICINEALMAYNLQKQGVAVNEIRSKIIAAYGKPE
ncbi:MAG TPA: CYCXC family (seleno)protein [Pyrinomonadaceae bacterium]|nr:CYCXC family (seleno)protein [Pyrinomonadaceae bacterium]